MRNSDRAEARAISQWWEEWKFDKSETFVPTSAEAAAHFAVAHAILELAKQVGRVADELHRK